MKQNQIFQSVFSAINPTLDMMGKRASDIALTERIKEIASAKRRYGYRRIHVLLRREGWQANYGNSEQASQNCQNTGCRTIPPDQEVPMSQLSFSDAEFHAKRKVTRREKFLAQMERVTLPSNRVFLSRDLHYAANGCWLANQLFSNCIGLT